MHVQDDVLYNSRRLARRHDLAAGRPKTRRVGHIFKILYWMNAATREPNVKWGGTGFKWGDRAQLAPRSRCP